MSTETRAVLEKLFHACYEEWYACPLCHASAENFTDLPPLSIHEPDCQYVAALKACDEDSWVERMRERVKASVEVWTRTLGGNQS